MQQNHTARPEKAAACLIYPAPANAVSATAMPLPAAANTTPPRIHPAICCADSPFFSGNWPGQDVAVGQGFCEELLSRGDAPLALSQIAWLWKKGFQRSEVGMRTRDNEHLGKVRGCMRSGRRIVRARRSRCGRYLRAAATSGDSAAPLPSAAQRLTVRSCRRYGRFSFRPKRRLVVCNRCRTTRPT